MILEDSFSMNIWNLIKVFELKIVNLNIFFRN